MKFKDGQKIAVLHFDNESRLEVGDGHSKVKSIEISMQNGQMAEVPWAKVVLNNGYVQMWNLAFVDGMTFEP
ncbi:hypothetical protein LCGC14_1279040 [marine sediment metagenome]|uniref:Uncharacterized protein n=1 Tax=marine sediment metagenome TaxID=412755 RepID=A0A0F9NCG3_9ZZZZ